MAKGWDGSFIDVGLCFNVCSFTLRSVLETKKASEIGGVAGDYFAYVFLSHADSLMSACENHTCVMLKEKMKTAVLSLLDR